jgi:HD-GYP domain-containing protein (c-di-GMP phosphodiesterase class II)
MVQVSISLGWDTKASADVDFSEILKNAEDDLYKNKVIQNQGLRGDLINTIIKTLYEKNPREEKHSERVGEVAQKIGSAIGFSETEVGKLKLIGHLHDIGKIAIEDGILNKEGKLSEREQEEVQRHPEVGYRILSATSEMLDLADCVLAHHERWDGKGYPRGITGEEIPIEARVIALADSYDAMSSERPYRKALNEEVILYEIKKNAGYQFDPDIARVFVEKILGKPWN